MDVKTSSCKRRSAGEIGEARGHRDGTGADVDLAHTGFGEREGQAGVELEHVVRDTRSDVSNLAEPLAAVVDDVEPDQVGDVVRAGFGRRKPLARNLQHRAALDGPVEPDDRATPRTLDLDHARGPAA